MNIGVFDSGVGGLSVLAEALSRRPDADFLYYADTDHVPYGEKPKQALAAYVDAAVACLLAQGAQAVVVACNTATSAAIDILRGKYGVPILGMEPAVKPALAGTGGRRVLVLATPLTLREQKLHQLLDTVDAAHCADLLPLPGLVRLAEREEFSGATLERYLAQAFAPYRPADYGAVVLGCTHFNYFKDSLISLFPAGTRFVDGCRGTVNHLLRKLGLTEGARQACATRYFESGRPVADAAALRRYDRLLARLAQMRRLP